jgi:hypothetical protein
VVDGVVTGCAEARGVLGGDELVAAVGDVVFGPGSADVFGGQTEGVGDIDGGGTAAAGYDFFMRLPRAS